MAVGEVWSPTPIVQKYVNGKFDFCFEFNLASALLYATDSHDPLSVKDLVAQDYDSYAYNQFSTFLSNHDQDRVMDYFSNDLDKTYDKGRRRPMQWDVSPNAGFTNGNPGLESTPTLQHIMFPPNLRTVPPY